MEMQDAAVDNSKIQHALKFTHIYDRLVPPRAVAVLPDGLQYKNKTVSFKHLYSECLRFGPIEGIRVKLFHAEANELMEEARKENKPIFLIELNEYSVTIIDTTDKDKCNWIGLLPLGDECNANVWLYEEDDQLYGITTKIIAPGTPLSIGYSKKYAEKYGLPSEMPVSNLENLSEEKSTRPKKAWCYDCHISFASNGFLRQHIECHHKAAVKTRKIKRRLRCKNCFRTFARDFTLKRHMNCCPEIKEQISDEVLQNKEPSQPQCDETRLPSDESLQNYTNSLDFSTNLFDTDRIPNLDISGSSKSENDFNPYSVSYKDDYVLSDLEFKYPMDIPPSDLKQKKEPAQTVVTKKVTLATCSHCRQKIPKGTQRRHIKSCPAVRLDCECGKVFTSKDKFTSHVYKEHNKSSSMNTKKDVPHDDEKKSHECELCKLKFKRRGIYVNHMWKKHKQITSDPVEKLVLRYPCSACPKIYATKSRRNEHVHKHHPGLDVSNAAIIKVGKRASFAASCPGCPRQYSTRAKMLQHVRHRHPHIATSIPKKTSYKL